MNRFDQPNSDLFTPSTLKDISESMNEFTRRWIATETFALNNRFIEQVDSPKKTHLSIPKYLLTE